MDTREPDCRMVGGEVRIRLYGAPPSVLEQLERELAAEPMPAAAASAPAESARASGPPTLEVVFGQREPDQGRLRVLGVTDGAFAWDDQSFHLLDPAGRRLTFAAMEPGCIRLRAEPGIQRLPLVPSLVGLLLLVRRRVLLHAAALRVGGMGILIPGWQSGGKTELVLGFAARAAGRSPTPAVEYAADEWTVVGGENLELDDRRVTGLPTPVQLWSWQLAQLPAVARRLPAGERRRLAALRLARSLTGAGLSLGHRLGLDEVAAARGVPVRSLVAFDGWLRHAERVAVPAATLGLGVRREAMRVDAIVLPVISRSDRQVRPIDATEVARRMLGSQAFERRSLDAVHAKARYAFPDRRWVALEEAGAQEAEILGRALSGIPAFEAAHPHPLDLAGFASDVAEALERVGH